MALVGKHLVSFCFKQLLGPAVNQFVEQVIDDLKDHSETLPKALKSANERTWHAFRSVLNDGWWNQIVAANLAVRANPSRC